MLAVRDSILCGSIWATELVADTISCEVVLKYFICIFSSVGSESLKFHLELIFNHGLKLMKYVVTSDSRFIGYNQ